MHGIRGWCVVVTVFLISGTVSRAHAAAPNTLERAEIQAGWISLFDGDTLFGWKANNSVDWKVKEGVIEASEGEAGLLLTTAEFSDYELRCDFWMAKGGNSGIFLQTPFQPKDPTRDCYELNICDVHPMFRTGSLVGLAQPKKAVTGEETWRTFHVTVKGAQVQVKLDGELILDYTNPVAANRRAGLIGLQKNVGLVRFRNVFLRPLTSKSLFNGRDLAGWRIVPGGVSTFKVVDGQIHIESGRGYLESVDQWADFVLQAEARTNGDHLNSGIFFRALPGTEKNPADGYECQIRNEWEGDDRTKPVDFGTGAIYRRIAARRVMPNDREWFTLTLLARGSQISVWVDGYQTTDWVDTRKPHNNPRNGLRTAAGHFSLQGHDPTTNLDFRNLRLSEFPAAASK